LDKFPLKTLAFPAQKERENAMKKSFEKLNRKSSQKIKISFSFSSQLASNFPSKKSH
jgi:hypothetical protein